MSNQVVVNTDALSDAALDWAMAEVENLAVKLVRGGRYGLPDSRWFVASTLGGWRYSPSTDLAQGGARIEKYRPDFRVAPNGKVSAFLNTFKRDTRPLIEGFGDTYLVATCRAIVKDVIGSSVMVPAELVSAA